MRRAIVVVVMLAAGCGGDDGGVLCTYEGETYRVGQTFPSGDGCNSCSCTRDGVACTAIACAPSDGGVDADPAYCGATGGCPLGPACGTVCCGQGERCNQGTCRCGPNAACTAGNSCEAAGPLGGDACGSVCCGTSGPCPQ